MSKTEWLDAMDTFRAESFEWDEIRVRLFGDVALLHCRIKQRAAVAG
jgi:hypothetical protein